MADGDLDAFASEVEALLAPFGLRPERARGGWGEGDDEVTVIDDPSPDQERAELAEARRFQRFLFDHGLARVEMPPDLGGRSLSAAHAAVVRDRLRRYEVPRLDALLVSVRILPPALLVHGEADARRVLAQLLRADLVGCQLFSEPEAGSDLAGARTRAVRDGDEWVLTGQKVWTSGAHYSDVGLCLARTDPDAPKHAGLTMFVVDLHAPGALVRPLRQITGGAHFNEVFLDSVRVPDAMRVGGVGDGWRVAITTLSGEREAVGDSQETPAFEVVERLVDLYRHAGGDAAARARSQVVRAWELGTVHEWTNRRLVAQAHGNPGPEMSIAKLLHNAVLTATTHAAATILGPRFAADTGAWGTYTWSHALVGAPGLRIAGGTDEIQRNILGERVLGLPKEPVPRP